VSVVDKLIGTYEGRGSWYDSSGKSSGYRVRQTNVPIADGFEVAFTHNFDDGTVVDAKFRPGAAFVEASYRASGEGLEVYGSSSSNAEGHYIAWTETLRRMP
jgi:hypothetical protein